MYKIHDQVNFLKELPEALISFCSPKLIRTIAVSTELAVENLMLRAREYVSATKAVPIYCLVTGRVIRPDMIPEPSAGEAIVITAAPPFWN